MYEKYTEPMFRKQALTIQQASLFLSRVLIQHRHNVADKSFHKTLIHRLSYIIFQLLHQAIPVASKSSGDQVFVPAKAPTSHRQELTSWELTTHILKASTEPAVITSTSFRSISVEVLSHNADEERYLSHRC